MDKKTLVDEKGIYIRSKAGFEKLDKAYRFQAAVYMWTHIGYGNFDK